MINNFIYIQDMKHIKQFEFFDFNQTLPITTKNHLTNFYSCDECDHLWQEYNKKNCNNCPECDSNEIEELPEDEWYEVAKSKSDDSDKKSLTTLQKTDSNSFVDLKNVFY